MPKITGSHSITRDGSNVILEYTSPFDASTVRVILNANGIVTIVEEGTDFVTLKAGDVKYSIDYNQSTSHNPTSVEMYANCISQITNEPADKLTIAQGNIANKIAVHKFGKNPAVTTTWQDVWGVGGNYNFLTTASTLEVIGLDTNDTAAGTGAREVTIIGLDENWAEATEAVATAGTSASSATTTTFIRVNRAYVSSVGTYGGTNFNNITIRVSSAGADLAVINGEETTGTSSFGAAQTELSVYTVPAGKTAYLTRVEANVDGSKVANVHFYKRESADDTTTPFIPRRIVWEADSVGGYLTTVFDSYIQFPEKTDLWFRAQMGTGTASVNISYDLIVVNNIL